MKIPLFLLVPFLVVSASHSFGQEAESVSRTVFKLSPQHFVLNSLKAGVERFNGTYSGSVAFFLTGRVENNENAFDEGYSGLAAELQLRKYISPMKWYMSKRGKPYHQGIYGAAYIQGGSYAGDFKGDYRYYDPSTGTYGNQRQYDYKESVGNWGFGFTMGYQKTLWQVIYLEAFIGGGIQFSDVILSGNVPDADYYSYSGIIDPEYKGILPKIGLTIGIGL